ncbi:MAG: NAD(+)/NADH kinase [Elusimicrobia bacterium]|nr:NAD(+)/NADH kinase [Elusimicrobiota bacterium]
MGYKIGIVYNNSKKHVNALVGELCVWLKNKNCKAVLFPSNALVKVSKVDFALSLGGDGTLLKAARAFAPLGVAIKGINLGTLGFLTNVEGTEIYKALEDIIENGILAENRQLFCAEISLGKKKIKTVFANDCFVKSGCNGRLISLDVFSGNSFVAEYKSDGIIVSTPMGSTAYSLAAGGAIVHPALNVMLLTPICPHTLTQRPMILPASTSITISTKGKTKNDKVVVNIDGQENYALNKDGCVKITAYPKPLKIIKNAGAGYFETLRKKLKWGV